jgi:diguanylate cyclase (GGDEF)-like protein/PAS domain S-box-containing protein
MRSGNLGKWLVQGTYPRLYVPVLLMILLASGVRYHFLIGSETAEITRLAEAEMRRVGDTMLPLLAAMPEGDVNAAAEVLQHGAAGLGEAWASLRWQVGDADPVELAEPPAPVAAPAWFLGWVTITPPVKQFGRALGNGRTGRLTMTLHPEPLAGKVWKAVEVQMRISALNIFTILFLLTLLLRANMRTLRRLSSATEAFRNGHLGTRMEVTGTLESRAMAEAFNDMAGKVQSLVVSLHDTQRQQSEQLHFQRQLIDALPLPVLVRDTSGNPVETNRAWQRLVDSSGVADAALPGSTGLLAGARRAGALRTVPLSAQLAGAQANEIRVRMADGTDRDMAYYQASFTSTSGVLAGTIGTLVDVTERNHAQQALRAEKDRAEITLASIGDGVITTDASGHVESINETAQLMTGFTMEQALGQHIDEVFRLSDEPVSRNVDPGGERDTISGALQLPAPDVLLHRSGERYAIEYTASAIREADGSAAGCVLVFRDVTETRNLRHQISWHARHDPLTGVYNRSAMAERLTHAIFVSRNRQSLLAVCMLDLDHFQAVNDAHGNRLGDRLLKETAKRLSAFALGPSETVARMGGDEFVLLLGDQPDLASIEARLAALLAQLSTPYAIDDRTVRTTVSIGAAVFPHDDANPDTLLRHADQAMCQAKSLGRNQVHFFDVQRDHAVQTHHTRQTRIAQALLRGELVLHYQPKVNLRTGAMIGVEALLRWQHPEQGLLGPQHVLPLIENTDLEAELGEWVLREALMQMRVWTRAGAQWEVSVNVAAAHFHRPRFVERLKELLLACPEIDPRRLELEILESAALDDIEEMRGVMRECQDLGVRFALDDFGTGFSSLSYLKRLPAETIKIDQSFVRGLLQGGDDATLISAIVGLAKAFKRHVLAEGVETPEQAARLLELGCERAQGFGIARPMPAADVLGWARARHAGLAATPSAPSLAPLPAGSPHRPTSAA